MIESKKLYILPFDHRRSFVKMFGVEKISDFKHIVYEGFLRSLELGVPKEHAAILVDEQFGEKVLKEARDAGIMRILTVEKSGQDEFYFEYGDNFADHIKKIQPEYVKVLVRYNAFGDKEINKRQVKKLKIVSDFCKKEGYKFLFELLAVATPQQLENLGGSNERYDSELRFEVMVGGMKELEESGIHPDIWKVEGLSDIGQMQNVVSQAKLYNENVGIVVLGRGEKEEKVKEWLTIAAKIEGVVGFAVGRTVFEKALLDFKEGNATREHAVMTIAKNYKNFVDVFEKNN